MVCTAGATSIMVAYNICIRCTIVCRQRRCSVQTDPVSHHATTAPIAVIVGVGRCAVDCTVCVLRVLSGRWFVPCNCSSSSYQQFLAAYWDDWLRGPAITPQPNRSKHLRSSPAVAPMTCSAHTRYNYHSHQPFMRLSTFCCGVQVFRCRDARSFVYS